MILAPGFDSGLVSDPEASSKAVAGFTDKATKSTKPIANFHVSAVIDFMVDFIIYVPLFLYFSGWHCRSRSRSIRVSYSTNLFIASDSFFSIAQACLQYYYGIVKI
jgi:hypothetical protein